MIPAAARHRLCFRVGRFVNSRLEPRMVKPVHKTCSFDRRQLPPGPVGQKWLSPAMLARTKAVFVAIGPYLGMTLPQFDQWFMTQSDPETEVFAWWNITVAWLSYHQTFLNEERQADDKERELLIALMAISAGVKDVAKFRVPEEVGQRLLQCYEDAVHGTAD